MMSGLENTEFTSLPMVRWYIYFGLCYGTQQILRFFFFFAETAKCGNRWSITFETTMLYHYSC